MLEVQKEIVHNRPFHSTTFLLQSVQQNMTLIPEACRELSLHYYTGQPTTVNQYFALLTCSDRAFGIVVLSFTLLIIIFFTIKKIIKAYSFHKDVK